MSSVPLLPSSALLRTWSVLGRLLLLGFGLALLMGARAEASSGPDVSNYQHPNDAPINWTQVRNAGHIFAYVKATEGPSSAGGYYTNPYFASDWAGIGAAPMYRGAYHFARPQYPLSSAVLQARYFVSVTGSMHGYGDLPPVLDLESTGGLPPADLASWTQSWLSEVERLTARRPIIYTGYYFWNDNVQSTAFGGYRLWMARYTSAPSPHPLPSSWPTWTFWQYTSSASVPGIVGNVDMNTFCCPDANLTALADGSNANPAAGNPFGTLDGATRLPGAISVAGWTLDPDTTAPLKVHVYVDGNIAGVLDANTSRPDVNGVFPGWGSNHGYAGVVPVTGPGAHNVCVYAINAATGAANTQLGCTTVVGTPVGNLDAVTSTRSNQLTAAGWAIDPDTDAPVQVHVYVDGKGMAFATADQPRADLTAAFATTSAAHGYQIDVGGLSAGVHTACAYAINVGSGAGNREIGCKAVSVMASDPVGNLDLASGGAGGVRVAGWTVDPDASASIDVHVYVDGVRSIFPTDIARPDVAGAFPGLGIQHGFDRFIGGLAPGAHQACAYGINTGPGTNALVGCRSFTVPTGSPLGSLDDVTARPSTLTVAGWALDPDVKDPIAVHVYIDGKKAGETVASLARPDVANAFPVFGVPHGYQATFGGIGGGPHTVCAYGINVGAGTNALAGCRVVTSSGVPFGSLDAVTSASSGTKVTVAGWAIDPDTTAPVAIHVYVDGVGAAILTANGARPDVAAAFPPYGPGHGYGASIAGLAPGPHRVCAFAINVGSGAVNPELGCATI
jgi:GH25 family lysozyme M1 (1,4-beta-N-acetylmuramidase)